MRWRFACLLFLMNARIVLNAQTVFINTGSLWKYNATGVDLGTAWRDSSYNDSLWLQGASELGYGDAQATVIPSGPSGNFYPTYYFRQAVSIADPLAYQCFTLSVKRDDGIVVYVNGTEVLRDNMPNGVIQYSTLASVSAADDGATWQVSAVPPSAFVSGRNVIAVEIHQSSTSGSNDVSFDMQLTGGAPPAITVSRGPYLQLGTPTSVYFRWRTSIKTDSKIRYGTSLGNLNQSVSDGYSTVEHIVPVTGLLPETKYYYSVGIEDTTLQGDSSNYFITAPATGSEKIARIWVTGDCGTASSVQASVRSAYQNFIGSKYTNLWLLLGDNAYDKGKDSEYQSKFFEPYMSGTVMRQTVLFPAPGNHDYENKADSLGSRNRPYHQVFTLPKAGEAGGVSSGTEMYYSYNYANIHFISLDSYGTESGKKIFDTTSVQINWLKQDLAANTQKWTILYWHHPPYTKGSHNSDTEGELIEIRDKVIRILDRYKVDLILCGHSHSYERSKIMKGHYGTESTFSPALHNASTSSGLYDGSANSCPYLKSTASGQNEGIVYVVAGSAGKVSGTTSGYPHNAMYYSDATKGGSLYIEVEGNRLDAKWIAADSIVRDKFTILKDANNSTDITINEGENANLTASWKGAYEWNPVSATAKTINVAPLASADYYVKDSSYNCVEDTFHVTVLPLVDISGTIMTENNIPIPGVTVKLQGSMQDSAVTATDGLYSFRVKQGGNYLVTPSKANDVTTNNGVTTFDISLIRRHILGSPFLSSPYKVIAADANGLGYVSTADIPLIRAVALNGTLKFPPFNSRLWEFVSSEQVFPAPMPGEPYNPFPFTRARSYNNITQPYGNQNFIGVKVGDVSGNWDPARP